jgi:RNA polymerase sigma-70 factor (ECF subfamily)
LDVYTQVWRQAHNYDETRGTPGGWLMTLARTRAIDRYRAGAAERGRIESLDTVEFFANDGDTPEEDLAGQERRRYVQQAMASLTAEQRKAITLAYFYGLSQSEIADKLKLPLGTVKTRMRLGMIKLREALEPYEEGLVSWPRLGCHKNWKSRRRSQLSGFWSMTIVELLLFGSRGNRFLCGKQSRRIMR